MDGEFHLHRVVSLIDMQNMCKIVFPKKGGKIIGYSPTNGVLLQGKASCQNL